jgi:putative DNA primase/helicase
MQNGDAPDDFNAAIQAMDEAGRWREDERVKEAQKKLDDCGLRALTIHELLGLELPPRNYLIDPILREKDLVMIYSWRGIGKSQFGLAMAYAIASGGAFLRWKAPQPRRVLYIDGELPIQTVQERLSHFIAGNEEEPDPEFFKIITPDIQDRPTANLSRPEPQDLLAKYLAGQNIEVVFIDSISTLCSVGRENEAESWLPVQEWALRLRRNGLTVVFIHHAGKTGTQRGTSRREDVLDTVIHLVQPPDYSPVEGARFEVHFEKTRGLLGDGVRPFETRLEVLDGRAVWTVRDLDDANIAKAAKLFRDGLSVRDVAEELKISKSAAGRLRSRAAEKGLLQ